MCVCVCVVCGVCVCVCVVCVCACVCVWFVCVCVCCVCVRCVCVCARCMSACVCVRVKKVIVAMSFEMIFFRFIALIITRMIIMLIVFITVSLSHDDVNANEGYPSINI